MNIMVFLIVPCLYGQGDVLGAYPATHTPAPVELLHLPRPPRDVSLRLLPINILHDQKNIWLFPGQVAEGRHLVPHICRGHHNRWIGRG